jgi:hypothetical protein
MESHTAADATGHEVSHQESQAGLSAAVVLRESLADQRVDEMYRLYAGNYLDTSAELFRSDLAAKSHVLLLQNAASQLCGFSTIELYPYSVDGDPVRVMYSGDTIIAPAYWGSPALAYEWLKFAGVIEQQAPEVPLYWLLIVKGHRTYRFLPTFARHYIPHFARAATATELRTRDVLATDKFGEKYDAQSGVVHFPSCMGRLTPELAEISDRHLRLPDVAHFVALNPGYRRGDELVCLCRLTADNLRPRAARIFSADGRSTELN